MLDTDQARTLCQALVERATAAGATAADAIYAADRSTSVEVRMGAIEQVGSAEGARIGLRLFDGARSASVAAADFSDDGLALLVEHARAMAAEAPEDPFAGLAPTDLLERDPPDGPDLDDGAAVSPAALRARALAAEQAGLAVPGVTNSAGASASRHEAVIALATSGGFSGAYRSGRHGCNAAMVAGEGSGMQRDHHWHGVRHLSDLDPAERIGREAGERAVARLNPARPRPGTYPVLFDPRVSGGLLSHFTGAIAGAAVARGTSFLKDRLGEPVFAPGVTIRDEPLRPRGLRSHPFDGEGVRVAPIDLVSDGRLNQWIAESASARQLGIAPTGHAARGVGGAPSASASNLWLEPGTRSRAELLAAYPEALLVVELIGQGVDPITGDYSRGAVGFMVRGGAIAEPVSEITIASNLARMFATLEPGSDLELRRGMDAPTVLIPEMTVAAA
jgi:PmbA protein